MLKNKPGARLAIYASGLIVVGALVLLNTFNVINDDVYGHAIGIVNMIGSILGVGAIGTAFTNLGRQKITGTFDISGGTPAEQLAQAAANYANQKAADEQAITQVLSSIPGGNVIADAVTGTTKAVSDVSDVVIACGGDMR